MGVGMANVAALCPRERIRFNPDKLTELSIREGRHGSEAITRDTLKELTQALRVLSDIDLITDHARARDSVHDLARLSARIGFDSVTHAAFEAEYCLDCRDPMARAATMARLLRVGSLSLTAFWEERDQLI